MTNGEKIETILNVDRDCTEVHGENGTMTFTVTQDFWNAEYQEPTKTCKSCRNYGSHHGVCDICKEYNCWTEKEPNKSEIPTGSTTKNDLGVDCIDKAELLKAMDTWDKFGYTAQYGLERLDKDDKGFVPYVKYDDMVNCVKGMPSVTPQEPKTGHWIYDYISADGHRVYHCSECGCYLKPKHSEPLDSFRWCSLCGAKMVEP